VSHLDEESGKSLCPDAVKVFKEISGQWEAEDANGTTPVEAKAEPGPVAPKRKRRGRRCMAPN
jgi:hypothetical protein